MQPIRSRLEKLEGTAPRQPSRYDGWYQAQSVADLQFIVNTLEHPEPALSDDDRARWGRLSQSFEDFAHEHA